MTTIVAGKAPRTHSWTTLLVQILRALGRRSIALYVSWKNRRAVMDLLSFDDHMLADIGVTRGDVVSALSLSADRDPSARLVVIAAERRASRRALMKEALDRVRVEAA